ncbi:MAG: KilA-N domain-containing protein [Cyanobacteria bacterium REEB417]|nr:KilA-N domain-containing protein [Cyanobacteria bacterium REEB417]
MKNAHSGPAVLSAGIEAREWNGCAILRRQADGFVNATAMCRAGGKRWNDYARVDRTREYICALAASIGAQTPCVAAVAGFPASGIHGLIDVIKGGRPELQGTWIHPRLAVDLARWISPSFAVWMDGWFLEAMGVVAAPPAPQPAPRPRPQPQHAHLRQDPVKHAASYLPALIAQRWAGDPDANGMIRAIAQHLLLSCDPLPSVAVVEGAAVAWHRALRGQTGQYGAGTHW